jgi:hypothetical protein
MYVIHVHAKEGEHSKVEDNIRLVEILSFVTKKSMTKCFKGLVINYSNRILFQILRVKSCSHISMVHLTNRL